MDSFTLFHFRFLADLEGKDENRWSRSVASSVQANWRGLAFERLCLQHVPQMKAALGIASVLTNVHAWYHAPDDVYPVGVQIDLLLDRADNVINVCEMKYFAGLYAIDKAADADFEQKLETFRAVTKTEKAVHLTLVTSRGLVRNAYANSVQSEVTLDDLFRA